MLEDLSALTSIRSNDITQHVFELLKDCSLEELKEFLPRVTDTLLREELDLVYNQPISGSDVENNTGRFSLSELVSRRSVPLPLHGARKEG